MCQNIFTKFAEYANNFTKFMGTQTTFMKFVEAANNFKKLAEVRKNSPKFLKFANNLTKSVGLANNFYKGRRNCKQLCRVHGTHQQLLGSLYNWAKTLRSLQTGRSDLGT